MRPFQEFRLWARRAPTGERVATTIAVVIAVALLAWLVVPEGDDAPEDVAAVGSTAATESGVDTTGVVDGASAGGSAVGADSPEVTSSASDPASGGSGAAPGGAGGASAPAGEVSAGPAPSPQAATGCVSPPGSAPGITAEEVKVIVVLTEVIGPAANELFDIPTPAEAKADFEAVIKGINKEGGIACRKVVARYVNANPTDEAGMIRLCRQFADAGEFAVIDTGSLATRPSVLACLGQNKIPYFGGFYITETLRQQFFPYLFSFYYKEQVYKNTAFALRDLGFYDPAKGFKKLGFIYRSCEKEAIAALRGWITEAGVPRDKVVTYNVGCPATFANEADLAQAVLTFQRAGVTHVIPANMQGDIARFTSQAERQGFRPKYGVPDEALLSIASGSRAPDPDNFTNAIAVTLSREGENKTPGMAPTAGTQRCNAYRKAAGLRPVYEVPANAGHACDQLWMLQGALGRAPELSRTALQVGLQRTKSIDFSFPQAPNDFTAPRATTGGQFFRVARFMADCDCWRLIQREFRRGY